MRLTEAARQTAAIGGRHNRQSKTCWMRGSVGMSCANRVNKLDSAQNGRGELLGNGGERVTSSNFQKRGNALLKNVEVIWINELKQIFGDSSKQLSSLEVRMTEIEYLNSPITGSKPKPIESLTRCKLSFSTHASCDSCGSVKKNTVTISWYPYEHRLDEYKQRGGHNHTPGNNLIEVVFGKVTQAIHEARLVGFHGHISSL